MHQPLQPAHFYHIYNRGINGENLFKRAGNYPYFLSKYAEYLSPVVDTYAYCLLKNHFHLLIRVKEESVIAAFQANKETKKEAKDGLHSYDFVVNKQFAKLFSSYTQSINKMEGRTGSLVETPFKRIEISNDDYLTQLIWYIHFNPQKHGFVNGFRKYEHSSYHSHMLDKPTKLAREEVLNWFGSRKEYEGFHLGMKNEKELEGLVLE